MTRLSGRARIVATVSLLVVLVMLGSATPAGAQPSPDSTTTTASTTTTTAPAGGGNADASPLATFPWTSEKMKNGFQMCMQIVDKVAHGERGSLPGNPAMWAWQNAPFDLNDELWANAVNSSFFRSPRQQSFTYHPRCDRLLPDNYESLIPARYHSDVYERCLSAVGGAQVRRPTIVPAWYWEYSVKKAHDCYLLLPLGAYGLGDDQNAWSTWTTDQERPVPSDSNNAAVNEAFGLCMQYIDWRMEHGGAGLTAHGLGDVYDRPPPHGVPQRVWMEALDFFKNHRDGDVTDPAAWRPDCELILTYSGCQPTGPGNRELLPELCVGSHPIANYDIGYSVWNNPDEKPEGTLHIPDVSRSLWGGTTYFAYQIGKGAVQVALWAIDWGFNFDISKYNDVSIQVGDAYQRSFLNHPGFKLRDLFWLLLFGWAGYMALRGRLAAAGGEVLVSIVLLLLATFLMANRQMYMDATWRLLTESETTLLMTGMGRDPSTASMATREELIRDVQGDIQEAFIEEPYDYLNWGQSLGRADDTGNPLRRCAAARYFILEGGPWGTDKTPRDEMAAAGGECEELVTFNRNPTGTRMLGAVLVMVSSITVAVLLIVVGLTIVVCKLIALLLFAVAPFVTVMAILPAQGRRMSWSWVATQLQVVMAVIGMSFLLSLLLLTLQKLIRLTGDVDLIERFALMDLVVMIVVAARRNLLRSGQLFAARLSEYLSSSRGSGATWASAAANARPGLNLLNVDRGAGMAVARPTDLATASVLLRLHERRSARRSYNNLERVAVWKRRQNAWNDRRAAVWQHTPVVRRFPVPVRWRPLP